MTLGDFIADHPPTGKHMSLQEYALRKRDGEYKKLMSPKMHYCMEIGNGISFLIPKVVYDLLDVPEGKTSSFG